METPLYQKIYDELASRIKSGVLKGGDKLPSERQLRKDFDASETSVRRALAMLSERGYISKRQGSGNYVGAAVQQPDDFDLAVVIPTIFGIDAGLHELQRRLATLLPDLKVKTFLLEGPAIEPEQARIFLSRLGKPALLFNSRNQTAEMARLGLLTPLDSVPGMVERFDRIPAHLKWRFPGPDGDSRIYGCPYLYTSTGLAVNLELAEAAGLDASKPPRTWAELLDWGRLFAKWSVSAGRYDVHPFFGYQKNFFFVTGSFYFMAMNGDPWSQDAEPLRRGLTEYFSFVESLLAGGMTEIVSIQSPDPFVTGRYLFHLQGGSWLPRDIERYRPGLRSALLPYPVPSLGRPRFAFCGTRLLSLFLPEGSASDSSVALLDAIFDSGVACDLAWRFGNIPSDPAIIREYGNLKPQMLPHCEALFTSFEPHFLEDEARMHDIEALIKARLDDPFVRVPDMVDAHLEFIKGNRRR